jgi:hypothetical protein
MICPLVLAIQEHLIDVDQTVREIDRFALGLTKHMSTTAVDEKACQQFALDLDRKLCLVWDSIEAATNHRHEVLSNVPAWLGPDSDDGGLGLLLERFTAPADSPSARSDLRGVWPTVLANITRIGWFLPALVEEWLDLLPTGDAVFTTYVQRPCDDAESVSNPVSVPQVAAVGLGAMRVVAAVSGVPAAPTSPSVSPALRVLFPAVHGITGHGLMVDMELGADAPHSDTAQILTADFVASVNQGRDQAITLSTELGMPDEVTGAWATIAPTRVLGVPSGYVIRDASAGAPTAMAVIGALLGLPVPDRMVTGGVTATGALASSPKDVVREKSEAAAPTGKVVLDLPSGTGLSEIAAAMWPGDWAAGCAQAAAMGLEVLGVTASLVKGLDVEYGPDGREIRLVDTPTLERLRLSVESGGKAMIVGGKAQSGRTTDARRIALEWALARDGVVIEIRTTDGRLPDPHDLDRACELVRAALGIGPASSGGQTPLAVILEDLIPYEDSVDLDAALMPVANSHILLVAVCMYTGGLGWSCEEVLNAPAPRGREQLRAFARAFLDANDLSCSDELIAVCQHEADGDLWLLINMLLGVGTRAEVGWESNVVAARLALERVAASPATTGAPVIPAERAEAVLKEYAIRTQSGLTGAELAEARAVAAASLLSVGIPQSMLMQLTPAQLRRLGGTRDYKDRWSIPRGVTCRGLLHGVDDGRHGPANSEPRWRRVAQSQYSVLASFLAPFVKDPDDQTVRLVASLMTSANAVEKSLHRRLLNLFTDMFTTSLGRMSPPATVAFALLAGGQRYEHKAKRELFAVLLRTLSAQGWEGLSLREATVCLHAIRAHRDLPYDRRELDAENLLSDFRDVLGAVHAQVRGALMSCRPSQGTIFVRELGLFFDELTARDLVVMAGLATERCRPNSMEDHQAAVRLIDYALKYGWDRPHQTLEVMGRSNGIRRLLNHAGHTESGLLMAQFALRLQLENWPEAGIDCRRLGIEVGHKLRRSDPRLVAEGLMLMQEVDNWSARVVVDAARFDDWLRRFVWSEDVTVPPWITNLLVRALTRVKVQVLFAALYSVDGSPSEEILGSMQASITATGDLKGVGHVLGAVAAADNVFGPGGTDSFTNQLTARLLTLVDHGLSSEMRSSVVLHTMSALVAAQLPADELRALLARCVHVIGAEARDNDKDSPARLALLLAQHEEVATEFLSLLDIELADDLLLDRISESTSVASRGSYLQVACALNRSAAPNFVSKFVNARWLEISLSKLQDSDALSALQAIQAYAQFLREADQPYEVQGLLDAAQPDGDWAPRLRRLHHPGQMSEALGLLRKMSRQTAAHAVVALDGLSTESRWLTPRRNAAAAVPIPRRNSDSEVVAPRPISAKAAAGAATPATVARAHRHRSVHAPGLTRLVRRHFVHPAQAIELISAIAKIDPGRARGVGGDLVGHESWNARVKGTLDSESVGEVGRCLLAMSRSGMWLTPRQQDILEKQWMFQGSRVRSVFAAETMLRGLVAAGRNNPFLGEEWASRLDLFAIGNRIARGGVSDLENVSTLISSLAIWGREDSAYQIASRVPEDAAKVISPTKASRLLAAINAVDPVLAKNHAQYAGEVLRSRSTRTFVVNRNREWQALGWYALQARRVEPGFVVPPVAIDAARAIADPQTRVWVVAAMGGPLASWWIDSDFTERSFWSYPQRLSRLVMASQAGISDQMGEDDVAAEVAATFRNAGFDWRAELLSCAATDPVLKAAFTPSIRAEIAEFAAEDLALGQAGAANIQDRLYALT